MLRSYSEKSILAFALRGATAARDGNRFVTMTSASKTSNISSSSSSSALLRTQRRFFEQQQPSTIETSIHLRESLKVSIYWDIPPTLLKPGEKPMKPFISDQPIAVGHISARLSDNVYAVTLDEVSLSSVIEVGSRVFLRADALGISSAQQAAGANNNNNSSDPKNNTNTSTPSAQPSLSAVSTTTQATTTSNAVSSSSSDTAVSNATAPIVRPKLELIAGLIARVNANGTFSILLDNDRFENAVPRSYIVISEGRSRFIHNESYAKVLNWVRNAGVDRRSDQESTATILYHRGWREDKLYLLESDDVHCLSHLNKAVRMCLLERAEWERDHHRQRRELSKERLKEREWRYVLTKYSGVMSACVAVLGVCSVFTWNFKNWQKQQRSYQLKQATETLRKRCKKPSNYRVKRQVEDELRRQFRTLDLSHPRLMVCIGPVGAGKSTVIKAAASSEELSAVVVDIRASDDPLRLLVKALGVVNIDACGDLMDFVAEACQLAFESSGHAPLIVFKLRGDERSGGSSLSKVYYEGIALACDRACCHVIVELNEESMRISDASLPRCHFFHIPTFDLSEVHCYTDRNIDPFDLAVFADVCGTHSTDLDDFIATVVVSKREEAHTYTRKKMEKAMRHLQLLWAKDPVIKGVLTSIAEKKYERGLRMRRSEIDPVYAAKLNEIKYALAGTSSSSSSLIGDLKELIYYNPLVDAWMFKNKVYHSAASCWSPPHAEALAV